MEDEDKYTITEDLYGSKKCDNVYSPSGEMILESILRATERLLAEKKRREEAMPSDEFKRICTVSSAGMLLKQATMILKEVASMDLGVDSKKQMELGEKVLDSMEDYVDFYAEALEKVKKLDVWKEKERDDGDGDDSE